MTLIINTATPTFVAHASDRLLTKSIGGGVRVHSDVENKSLILVGRDFIGLIGYTGSAYIESVPADEWIASTIAGEDLSDQFMIKQPGVKHLTFRSTIWAIENALRSALLPRTAEYLGVSMSGIRKRRGYMWPFVWELARSGNDIRRGGYARAPVRKPHHLLSQIGDPLDFELLQSIFESAAKEFGASPEGMRQALIRAIRKKATMSALVGDEITSALIVATGRGFEVLWRFDSLRIHHKILRGRNEVPPASIPAFYSPWIISPGSVMKPSFGSSHFDSAIGNVSVRNTNEIPPISGSPYIMAVGSQLRKGPR